MNYYSVADPGDGPGLPLIIFDQTEARNKFFGDQAPQLYQGLDDCPPPTPPPLISRSGSGTTTYLFVLSLEVSTSPLSDVSLAFFFSSLSFSMI